MNSISSATDQTASGWHVEVDDDGREYLVLEPALVARLSDWQKRAIRVVHEAVVADLLPDWDDLIAQVGFEGLEEVATRRLHGAGADRG